MSALKNRLLFIFIFLFLALRLTTLLTAVEEVSWSEELFTGVLPREWMHNWKLPIWEYQASERHSGSLLVGALATPFFLLFGPNLFALKLVPLLFSLGTLVTTAELKSPLLAEKIPPF